MRTGWKWQWKMDRKKPKVIKRKKKVQKSWKGTLKNDQDEKYKLEGKKLMKSIERDNRDSDPGKKDNGQKIIIEPGKKINPKKWKMKNLEKKLQKWRNAIKQNKVKSAKD